ARCGLKHLIKCSEQLFLLLAKLHGRHVFEGDSVRRFPVDPFLIGRKIRVYAVMVQLAAPFRTPTYDSNEHGAGAFGVQSHKRAAAVALAGVLMLIHTAAAKLGVRQIAGLCAASYGGPGPAAPVQWN